MRRRRSSLFSILFVAAVGFALAGIALTSAYFYLRGRAQLSASEAQDVWAAVDVDAICPPLALRPLAGEPTVESVRAALSVDDLDTAFTTLAFSPTLSDEERIGHLLLLAHRYADVDQASRAADCLRQTHSLIVLSPQISDVARADAAFQAATLWSALGSEGDALFSLAQAEVVVEQSARLRPAQRRDFWLRLAESYEDIGDVEKAAAARKAADRRHEEPLDDSPAAFLPGFLGDLPASEEVHQAQEDRKQRAVTLIDQWIALDGGDVAPEIADLAEFLRREDTTRLAYLERVVAETPELAVRARALWERCVWLTLKYRIARGGLGLSLIPEWEEHAPVIRSELTKAYEDLFRLYDDQATALPVAHDVDQARVELLRQEVLLGELELYPDYPEDQVRDALREAQQRLQTTSGSGIWVAWDDERSHSPPTLK